MPGICGSLSVRPRLNTLPVSIALPACLHACTGTVRSATAIACISRFRSVLQGSGPSSCEQIQCLPFCICPFQHASSRTSEADQLGVCAYSATSSFLCSIELLQNISNYTFTSSSSMHATIAMPSRAYELKSMQGFYAHEKTHLRLNLCSFDASSACTMSTCSDGSMW